MISHDQSSCMSKSRPGSTHQQGLSVDDCCDSDQSQDCQQLGAQKWMALQPAQVLLGLWQPVAVTRRPEPCRLPLLLQQPCGGRPCGTRQGCCCAAPGDLPAASAALHACPRQNTCSEHGSQDFCTACPAAWHDRWPSGDRLCCARTGRACAVTRGGSSRWLQQHRDRRADAEADVHWWRCRHMRRRHTAEDRTRRPNSNRSQHFRVEAYRRVRCGMCALVMGRTWLCRPAGEPERPEGHAARPAGSGRWHAAGACAASSRQC